MNDKTQHGIACAAFVVGTYAIYCGGSVASGQPMPDGILFGSVALMLGLIFGYKFKMLTAGK
jgi:hypothetical protein